MDKFITEFKAKAHAKNLKSHDMVALVFYKAIKAKSEHKVEVAIHLAKKAFTPTLGGSYAAFHDAKRTFHYQSKAGKVWRDGGWVDTPRTFMGIPIEEVFTPEEIEILDELMTNKVIL